MSKKKTIQVFDFAGRKVRTAGTHDAPLFCAADVGAILEYADVARACERLDQDEVHEVAQKMHNPSGRGTGRPALYVTESGLYSLILWSHKPEAKAFRKWVTSEVLPAIRKHGFYSAIQAEQERQTERLLGECFPNLPSKSAPIFRDLIAALVRLRRDRATGNPPWARKLASMVYEWAIHVEGQQLARRKRNPNPSGSSVDHSMLSEVAAGAVKRVVQTGTDFARIASSYEHWKSQMELAFGRKAKQLPILVPMNLLPTAPRGRR